MTSSPAPPQRLLSSALLPSALLVDDDAGGGPVPRTARDWFVDICAVLVSAGLAALFFLGDVADRHHVPLWQVNVDWILGVVCIVAIWWRRRWPTQIGVLTTVLSTVSSAAAGTSVIALFTVAVHRRWQTVAVVGAVNVLSGTIYTLYRPQDIPFLWATVINFLAPALVIAWGLFVRARRQLVWTLRERAERAESEQRLLADRARVAERTRIAREMHDVLAHRLSLMALHAGGLQLRPDLPADEVRETAELLRSTAHHALEELRSVIGVLRAADDDLGTGAGHSAGVGAPEAPQPTLGDIGRLVEETRATGARIEFSMDVPAGVAAPGALGRDAYRIVQEALTNIAKHARGTACAVTVSGAPGAGLHVDVRNRLPVGTPSGPALPGSGNGLLGLHERVTLAGGTLRHGPNGDGEFEVDARLSWPAP